MSKQSRDAFPDRLKLNPFEQYMLVDDRPDLPMVIRVRVECGSRIDHDRLAKALDGTLQSHPLLRSIVVQNAGSPCWQDSHMTCEYGKNVLSVSRIEQPITHLDLYASTGLRVQLLDEATKAGSSIVLDFHHSCCDGLGVLRFIEQLFDCYKQGDAPKRVELSDLRTETHVLTRFAKLLFRLPQEIVGALALFEYFSHSPISLKRLIRSESSEIVSTTALSAFETGSNGCPLANLQKSVPADEFQRVRQTLKSRKMTVNDHFVGSVFSGIDAWSSAAQKSPFSGHLRVLIPMNMRDNCSDSKSSVNEVSMIYLDRRPWKHKSFDRLAAGIRMEMGAVKKLRLGQTFQRLLSFMIRSRIGLQKLVPTDRCIGTTLASNLGVIALQKDNVSIKSIDIVPPIRPQTQASFVCYTFDSKFHISMAYNTRELSETQAAGLLERVVRRFSAAGRSGRHVGQSLRD